MNCTLTLDMARENFAGVLLEWIDEPTARHRNQLVAAAVTYAKRVRAR